MVRETGCSSPLVEDGLWVGKSMVVYGRGLGASEFSAISTSLFDQFSLNGRLSADDGAFLTSILYHCAKSKGKTLLFHSFCCCGDACPYYVIDISFVTGGDLSSSSASQQYQV